MIAAFLRKMSFVAVALCLIVIGIIIGAASIPERVAAREQMLLTDQEALLSTIYRRVSPSVVAISIRDAIIGEISGGSGFVIDKSGHIITNFHVVDNTSEFHTNTSVEVNFIDGTIVRAEILGRDPDSDLALLKVDLDSERLFPVMFGNSDELIIGQTTLAIGSPFGQRWTLTSGIVSALGRSITGLGERRYRIGSVIQTDAAINPGNSGGPLLNLKGEVIGVNAQIISEERANSGVGFAIPSNLVKRVAGDLLVDGSVSYSYLGVTADDITLSLIERLGLPNNTRGVSVSQVSGPAASAGVQNRDVIVGIDGRQVYDFSTLIGYLAGNTKPGQSVMLTVLRSGRQIDIEVTLGTRPTSVR
jgi:S1-C subfamily serine protease